eukprot:Clim_evm17s158 gene=Clim_evmTU17s158
MQLTGIFASLVLATSAMAQTAGRSFDLVFNVGPGPRHGCDADFGHGGVTGEDIITVAASDYPAWGGFTVDVYNLARARKYFYDQGFGAGKYGHVGGIVNPQTLYAQTVESTSNNDYSLALFTHDVLTTDAGVPHPIVQSASDSKDAYFIAFSLPVDTDQIKEANYRSCKPYHSKTLYRSSIAYINIPTNASTFNVSCKSVDMDDGSRTLQDPTACVNAILNRMEGAFCNDNPVGYSTNTRLETCHSFTNFRLH